MDADATPSGLNSRRRFLKGCGCCVVMASAPGLAGPASGGPGTPVIDIHYHVTTEVMRKLALADPKLGPGVAALPRWSAAQAIEAMDRDAVSTSVISMPVNATNIPGGGPAHRDFARTANEEAAAIVAANPGRFRFFATTALPYIDETLGEIAYALDTLKASGVYMCTSYVDKWLGDDAFKPVLEELDRRGAIVFTHPMGAACCTQLQPQVQASTVEFGTDTTRTIASLIFSGAAARYPNIRFIFSHAGGTAPYLFERFDLEARRRKDAMPGGVLPLLRAFYYDTAQAANPYALGTLAKLVPPTQLLFGSDGPWRQTTDQLAAIDAMGFDSATKALIRSGNAKRLLSQPT